MTNLLKTLAAAMLLAGLAGFFCSCEKIELEVSVPSCVEKKIREINKQPVWNPPAQVWKWESGGSTYYYFTSDCCDQFNLLYDDECNYVCAPDGGWSGAGDGNCPEFPEPVVRTLVWEDER